MTRTPRSASEPAVEFHLVLGQDVVLDQNGDAMEDAAVAARRSLGVTLAGDRQCVGVGLDDGAEKGIELGDPSEIRVRQRLARHRAREHQLPQFEDGRLEPGSLRDRFGGRQGAHERADPATEQQPSAGCRRRQERSSGHTAFRQKVHHSSPLPR